MFESLKKKLGGWFGIGKKEGEKEKTEKRREFRDEEPEKRKGVGKRHKKEERSDKKSKEVQVRERTEEKLEEGDAKGGDRIAIEDNEILTREEVSEEIGEKKGFFGRLAQKLTNSELTKEEFAILFEEFSITLLEHNVALGVVDKIKESLERDLVGKRFGKKEVGRKILEALRAAIEGVLIEPPDFIEQIRKKEKAFVILFFGINGSGKTTSIAKVASLLKSRGISCVFAAGDTFRAASIEQLEHHSRSLGVPIVKQHYQSDPAAVAFDAIQYAKAHRIKVVLIDSAGRMYTKGNLMREMEKISRVSKPDLKIFVGESITGNDVLEQVRMFQERVGIDGIILSKADVDEKAGTILSVSFVSGKPIYFLGVGQGYEDLEVFSKARVLQHLGL